MISLFELFKVGIGPSSSHTVGPMLAANQFVQRLASEVSPKAVCRITAELFGSLALTGIGHHTDRAVVLGLEGNVPSTIDPAIIESRFEEVRQTKKLRWFGEHWIDFDLKSDLLFHGGEFLPQHPNGMRFTARDNAGRKMLDAEYFSIGGGFVIEGAATDQSAAMATHEVPFEFRTADELIELCRKHELSISQIVQQNELSFRNSSSVDEGLDAIWRVMSESIEAGCSTTGTLPGGLNVRRRAAEMHQKLTSCDLRKRNPDALDRMDWVAMFALAVNEQNAAGGRVVTAPTNGAAGVIPAVIAYYERFMEGANREGVHEFLRTSAAIGMLYKRNASLSAAEMGCQGEVGVACSMAAGGLAAVMGGTPQQIENAAEIGMEHNLGLTCDPVRGLVQVPCIERNTMGAIKAINAARLAVIYGDGSHRVSLDRVIETMRQTGIDMQSKYKETSLGGLAVNVTSC